MVVCLRHGYTSTDETVVGPKPMARFRIFSGSISPGLGVHATELIGTDKHQRRFVTLTFAGTAVLDHCQWYIQRLRRRCKRLHHSIIGIQREKRSARDCVQPGIADSSLLLSR